MLIRAVRALRRKCMCVRMGRVEVRVEGDESRMVVTFVSEGRDHPPDFTGLWGTRSILALQLTAYPRLV
jgi:hypothetical protein